MKRQDTVKCENVKNTLVLLGFKAETVENNMVFIRFCMRQEAQQRARIRRSSDLLSQAQVLNKNIHHTQAKRTPHGRGATRISIIKK